MAEGTVSDKVVKAADHNRYLVVAVVMALAVMVVLQGCPARTESLREPGKMVTGLQVERELADATADYEAIIAKAKLANADLDRQYALRRKALDFVGGIATVAAEGGNPLGNPVAAVGGIIQLAALGLLADNRRKDKIIKARKTS